MEKKSAASMGRTIGIAVGCAAAYIVLVVGLMIYCKGRRARQNKKEEVLPPECENCKCSTSTMGVVLFNVVVRLSGEPKVFWLVSFLVCNTSHRRQKRKDGGGTQKHDPF